MIGRILQNRYRILKKLGQGNFCETYLVEDINLKKPRVVKKLQPQINIPKAKNLFEREIDVLNKLEEKKYSLIPQLFDSFEENQEFYLVQEYIEGHTLDVELNKGPMSEIEVRQLLIDILTPLKFLHEQNIIHRDIKPSNLIRRQSDNKICIIDFGAVKQIFTASVNYPTTCIGTPIYMPLEQERGSPKLASDIYAVGIIGIQALTGSLPQIAPNTSQVIWQKPPSVSNELAAILNKMTDVDYNKRYQTASEALSAVEQTVVLPVPPPPPPNLTVLIAATILALSLSCAAILGVYYLISKPAPSPQPNQPKPVL